MGVKLEQNVNLLCKDEYLLHQHLYIELVYIHQFLNPQNPSTADKFTDNYLGKSSKWEGTGMIQAAVATHTVAPQLKWIIISSSKTGLGITNGATKSSKRRTLIIIITNGDGTEMADTVNCLWIPCHPMHHSTKVKFLFCFFQFFSVD